MKRLVLSAATALFLFAGTASAQLAGTINIPGSYPTLAAAITDLNTVGVAAGGVTLDLAAFNPQTAPVGGYVITATGTVANPIVITGHGNMITAGTQAAGTLNDAIFKIIGGDYITISGFQTQENPANTDATPGTNTMTEWGVALLYASPTNGAQFNTIVGNTISLNRTYANTFGIYSNTRHNATSVTTTNDITSPAGSNSNNKVWANGINNVNMAIAFIGSNVAANQDVGNDIGGTSFVSTGNNISNWGGAAAASGYVSNTGTSYCIFMNHQTSYNVSYNAITSANVTPTVTFRGIVQDYTATAPTGTFTNTISFNSITMTSGQTSGTFRMIDATTGGTGNVTLNILNNIVQGSAITGVGSSSNLGGIFSAGALATLNISNNSLRGMNSSATSGGFTGISSSSAVTGSTTISNNEIGTALVYCITFSAAQSGTVAAIVNSAGAVGSTVTISGNDIRGIVHSVTGSSTHTYISNTANNPNTNISNNTFTNLVMNSTGSLNFITNNVTHAANTTHNVNNNSIVTAFNKTGAGGTIFFYNSFSTSLTAVSEINNGNNFSNLTFIGATTISGWRCGDGSTTTPFGPNKTVTNNTFSNITGGTGTMQILEVDYSNAGSSTNNVSGNVISNLTNGNTITGIVSAQGNQNFVDNILTGFTSTSGNLVMGMSITNGAAQNIFRNKIGNMQSDGASGQVIGIRISGGAATTVTTIYNNLIGDLRAPSASGSNQLMGISLTTTTSGQTTSIFYNTIYINGASTGTDFGSSGIQCNTASALELRNNLVVNTSAPNGTGLTVAFRRNNTTLTTYANTSGNNSFYAGTPSASSVVFYDGTNSDQTIVAYRTRVAPRDAASITANPTFASTSAASTTFLHIPAATPSGLESAGMTIASFNYDFDNDGRPGPVGSVNGGGTAPDIGADEFDGIPGCSGTPTATAAISSAVCGSGSFILSLTGSTGDGISYQWQESSVAGGPYTNIAGATTGTYTTSTVSSTMYYVAVITCAYSGNSITTSEVTGTVNALPTVTANATATTVCNGTSVMLNGSGATSYAWTGSVTDNVPFNATATTTYTVTGTDANGCTDTDVITITVNPLPVVTLSGNSSFCIGDSTHLTGSSGGTSQWYMNGQPIAGATTNSYYATAVGVYNMTKTNLNGCVDSAAAGINVTINSLPMVGASTTADPICAGDAVTLTGSGAVSYVWTGGVTDGAPFNPVATDTYTVTGTDANGCSNTMSISVTVNALPNVSLSGNSSFCAGDSTQLTGSSGGTSQWYMDGQSISGATTNTYYATTAGTYNMIKTNLNGCSDSASAGIAVIVNALPTVTVTLAMDTLCDNGGLFTLNGETPSGGAWSGNGVSGTTFDPMAGVGMMNVITYDYTDANGCSASAIDSLWVDICSGVNEIATGNVSVYPNPNVGLFTIQLSATPAAPVQVEILNALGQSVNGFTMTATAQQVDLGAYEGGVYFVRITEGSSVSVIRVVKQ